MPVSTNVSTNLWSNGKLKSVSVFFKRYQIANAGFYFFSEEEKVKFRNARHQHVLLTKGNKDKVQEVEILEDKCNQAMMLKFGRIVDIDSLGTVTVSRAVEEARDAVRQNEIKLAKEEHKMEQQVQALKSDLSKLVSLKSSISLPKKHPFRS